jgi:hypothetical protein
VGVGVAVVFVAGAGDKVVVGVADAVGCALTITTLLLQRSFFRTLIHVYFLLLKIFDAPCFEQIDPSLGRLLANAGRTESATRTVTNQAALFMQSHNTQ